jgi:hypothetical protein
MELLKNKYIRSRLWALAIVTVIAIVVELVVYLLLIDRPILQVKALGMISLALIGYLLHTSYKIWYWLNNPFHQNGLPH